MLKQRIKRIARHVPVIGKAYRQRDELRNITNMLWVEPGHFYSPIPDLEQFKAGYDSLFQPDSKEIAGVELNEDRQLSWIDKLGVYYSEMPFQMTKQPHIRYYFDNPAFSYFDAIVLYCLLRHLKPKRIIEIGSGYSSCVFLDTNELFFADTIQCTFIEPYPQLLEKLITKDDRERIELVPQKLEEISPDLFSQLRPNDILFVDSSHVTKTNSDVNRIFFDVLPLLEPGVYVHFHDVCFPFEYPKEWLFQGRAWNEAYLLRAFLQYNKSFEIEIFNSFLNRFHRDKLRATLPLCVQYADENILASGLSLWLRKVSN